MGTVLRKRVPWWQQAALIWALGMITVLLVALSVVLAMGAVRFGSDQRAYDAAPECSSTANTGSCRFQGPARVVSTWWDKQGFRNVEVVFDQLGGLRADGALESGSPSEWQRWQPEDQLEAELWHHQLTIVGGTRTTGNPDLFVETFIPAAYIVSPIALALLVLLVFWGVVYRRAAKTRAGQDAVLESAHPTSVEQLPLTPDMTSYLQTEVAVGSNPVQLVGIVLAAAALLPLIFTAVFYVQGRFWQLWTFLQWVFFLGGGGVFSWWILHTVGLEKRDLAGGVYSRASGVFHVAVFQGKGGTSTQVTIGGRTVRGGLPYALDGIDSALGSVDYLPACGELLEVRDESGQVLWTRFATSDAAAPAQSAAR